MANIVVTNLNDAGAGSLREAIATASGDAGADTITFAAGLSGGTLRLTSGTLQITSDLTIDGDVDGDNRADIVITADANGDDTTTVDGFGNTITDAIANVNASDNFRVLEIGGSETNARLESLVVTGGEFFVGAGITVLSGNTLAIYDSTIAGNSGFQGGGINNSEGTLLVVNSTISGNDGSGVFSFTNTDGSQLTTIINTTFVGNNGTFGGAIQNFSGRTIVQNSTIYGNTATSGGGINSYSGQSPTYTNVESTIIAGNTARWAGTDDVAVFGATNSFADSPGNNLIGQGSNLFFNGANGNIVGSTGTPVNPMLGALGDHGGSVETILLQGGSMAIDAGSNPSDLTMDARGAARSFDLIAGGGITDIGATELHPQAFKVTTLDDELDFNGPDATIAKMGGLAHLSLREALFLANQNTSTEDTIAFAPSLSGGTLRLTQGELLVTSDVSINGDADGDNRADIVITGDANGDDATTADSFGNIITDAIVNTNSSDNSSIFTISGTGTDATLTSLVVTGGLASGTSPADGGGGIHLASGARLTLDHASITGNAAEHGGGIYNSAGILLVTNSSIAGNVANQLGGGVYSATNLAGTQLTTIINTTITDNTADDGGGLFNSADRTVVQNSTIAGNDATTSGGGISSIGSGTASTQVESTVIAGNTAGTAGSDDVALYAGSATNSFSNSPGNNLIGDGNSLFTDGVAGNIVGNTGAAADPMLGAFGDNGGPVETMLAQTGSQVIDAGSNPANQTSDARGGVRVAGAGSDIGATELQQLSSPATPQAFEVTTLNDELDFSGPDATITTMGGLTDLSLREALFLANQNGTTADTITFAPALSGGTLRLTRGELEIIGDVSVVGDVNGDDRADVVITGDVNSDDATATDSFGNTVTNALTNTNTTDNSRVFSVTGSATEVTLSSLIVTGGSTAGHGGGIYLADGTLSLEHATITGNNAQYGGGVSNRSGTLLVTNATIAGNTSSVAGAGIYSDTNLDGSQLTTIINTTIAGNATSGRGGGIDNADGRTIVNNSTISGNAAGAAGGISSLGSSAASTDVTSTIIAGNTAATAGTADVALYSGSTNSFAGSPGNNLIGNGNGLFTNGVSGNIVGSTAALADPMLYGLQNLGGPVETMLPQAGSLAIDAGNNPLSLASDARGATRVVASAIDIGAVEVGFATANDDILVGTPNMDSINGLAGNDTIVGLASDDIINGGAGADTMHGNAGNDTMFVNDAGDKVIEIAGEGLSDRVATSTTYTLARGVDVELFTTTSSGSTAAINLTGNERAQTIIGNAAANVITDGLGAGDLLRGLGGNDTYIVRNATTNIIESGSQGNNDRLAASTSYTLGARVDIELLTTTSSGGTAKINLTGNERAQTIIGNAGANVIIDGLGAGDLLRGLDGNDTYIVRNAATKIIEGTSQGNNDRVAASTTYTLATGVDIELLTTTSSSGTEAINLTGNERTQTIIGNAAANVITDGAGAGDLLRGLDGNDTYIVKSAATRIIESGSQGTNDRLAASLSYTLARGVDIELFTTTSSAGTAAINLTGNERAQTIFGNAGDNVITDGFGAADTLRGLVGNDTYIVRNSRTKIIEYEGHGASDKLAVSTSYALESGVDIELFTTTSSAGTGNFRLTGNNLAQTIIGNAGDNQIIDGRGAGAGDLLRGLGGNDTYYVRSSTTKIAETTSQGTNDTLIAYTSYTLDPGVEIELFTTQSVELSPGYKLTGNELSQTIIGNAGDNVIRDGGGAGDILRGMKGDDTYIVKSPATVVIEERAHGAQDAVVVTASHTLASGSSIELFGTTKDKGTKAINLTANDEKQIISGNYGNNRIDSKGGSDIVGGLDGNDTFIFSSALDRKNVDIIVDFNVADDQIELDRAIFDEINQSSGTMQSRYFEANSQGVANDAADRIIYNTESGKLWYDADGTGSASAQQFALVHSGLALASTDFDIV